ncbi:hypothetical protein [Flammeovirga aprica]|uniref:Uncharacterized protein n=1 Tax=Flammeovirga aprica JL-4 TaxID=694437 RepID=A0A7X9NZ59_9BACT|nr:hypothetical protein [Flammeovirga aprica]NME66609.1 hypothetical protein [Flammeovirga aprica JL-4]
MIDGFKILIRNAIVINKLLSHFPFAGKYTISEEGELILHDYKLFFKYKGLDLMISKGKNGMHCTVKGSLHKFWNEGVHNANTYTYQDFIQTLKKLKDELFINPKETELQNIEFGVNIELPKDKNVKTVLRGLIANGNKIYEQNTQDGALSTTIKRDNYTIKTYDKTAQTKSIQKKYKPKNNLLRLEVAYNKMKTLKAMGVYSLFDLSNIGVFKSMGLWLLERWADAVFIDRQEIEFITNRLTLKQCTHFYYMLDAPIWEESEEEKQAIKEMTTEQKKKHLNQRKEARRNMLNSWRGYMCQHSKGKLQVVIYDLIQDELKRVQVPLEAVYNPFMNDLRQSKLKKVRNRKTPLFPHLDKRGNGGVNVKQKRIQQNQKGQKTSQKMENRKTPLNPQNSDSKKCLCCGADISHKSKNAKYCSKSCNNKCNRNKRKKMNEVLKQKENPVLIRLMEKIHKNSFNLSITYTQDRKRYTDQLHQKEVFAPIEWIRKIKEVKVWSDRKNAKKIVLTGTRAMRFIREVSKRNQA